MLLDLVRLDERRLERTRRDLRARFLHIVERQRGSGDTGHASGAVGAAILAHAEALSSADVERLHVGPFTVGTEHRQSRDAARALITFAGQFGARVETQTISRPFGALRTGAAVLGNRTLRAIGDNGLNDGRLCANLRRERGAACR